MLWADVKTWFSLPWAETLVSAAIALVVMLIVTQILIVVGRRLGKWRPTTSAVLSRAERPSRYLLPLIGLQAVWNSGPPELRPLGLIAHTNSVLLIAVVTWLGMRCIDGVGQSVLARHPLDMADNLQARSIATQTRVIARVLMFIVLLIGAASALITFPGVRQIGVSLLASAGMAGLVAGIAAKPVLGNLIAGLQIALTQPIRIDDVVIVEGEWGRIEEITGTYVSVRIWDERRLVVPLQWFIEHPFQNWTRVSADIIGSVFIWVDYRMPLSPLRAELERICKSAPNWDGRLALLQVTETSERAMQLRILVSSTNSSTNWDLRCLVREELVAFIQRDYPDYLPTVRATITTTEKSAVPVPD